MLKTRRFAVVMMVLVAVYAAYYVYFGPRLIGDAFALSLVNFDTAAMNSHLCENASVASVLNTIGTTDDQMSLMVIAILRGIAPPNVVEAVSASLKATTRYDPFSGEYGFSLTLGTDVSLIGLRFEEGLTTPEFRLSIQRGLLRPCVMAA